MNPHPIQQAHVKRALLLVLMGECVPSLYLGLLYYTLDIKLNVPWNSRFFFFFQGILWFCCTLNILILGGYGEQIHFGKIVAVLFKVKEKSISFLKDILCSSWYHKRQGDLILITFWHFVPGYCSRNQCGTISQGSCQKIGDIMCWNYGLA